MNTKRTSRSSWLLSGVLGLVLAASMVVLPGCTDLDEDVFSAVTADNFFETEEEKIAGLAPVYAQLRSLMWAYHNLSQVTSDETVVPTRGTDWDDGGRWRAMHTHDWDASLVDLNDAWVSAFTGVARANAVLPQFDPETNAGLIAEVRFLRAFYYYLLMDFFGGVPIVTEPQIDPDNPPSRATRAEVFNFIEEEVTESIDELPWTWDAANYGRATKAAAYALLARMYLNAEVFTGTVSASGLQRGQARWQDAINAVDQILNSGEYQLADNWFANFAVDNQFSPELLMSIGFLNKAGLGLTFNMRQLHYKQPNALGGPAVEAWNGFATLAEVYNAFDEGDPRKDIFLVGQQFDANGNPLTERDDSTPLAFTEEISALTGQSESAGIRILKWEFDPNFVNGEAQNDYGLFRLGDMYLIKAEALNELGQTGAAVNNINIVRNRVDVTPLDAGNFNQATLRDQILKERLNELTYEASRRQDLIRHGKFTTMDWALKNSSDPYRVVFPVPQVQIDANPRLSQNAGY